MLDHNVYTLDGKDTFHGMGIVSASTNMTSFELIGNFSAIKRQKLCVQVLEGRSIEIVSLLGNGKPVLSDVFFKPISQMQFEKNLN